MKDFLAPGLTLRVIVSFTMPTPNSLPAQFKEAALQSGCGSPRLVHAHETPLNERQFSTVE